MTEVHTLTTLPFDVKAQIFINEAGERFGIVGAGSGDNYPDTRLIVDARTPGFEKAFNATYTGEDIPIPAGTVLTLIEAKTVETTLAGRGTTYSFKLPEFTIE